MDLDKLKTAFEFAKAQGLDWVEVDGVRMPVPIVIEQQQQDAATERMMKAAYSAFQDVTDEEILYYATPYYDELQARKKAQQDAIREKEDLTT